MISKVLFTSEQLKKNKVASHFASVSEGEIISINEEAVPKNIKTATKFGLQCDAPYCGHPINFFFYKLALKYKTTSFQ